MVATRKEDSHEITSTYCYKIAANAYAGDHSAGICHEACYGAENAVLQKQQTNKTKAVIGLSNTTALPAYLLNHFGINDLEANILKYTDENLTRSEAIEISGNSKLKTIRTFKGFLVNAYQPILAKLNNKELIIQPSEGSYTYIHDYETFFPDVSVTIVGIENPENFRYIQRQQYLFPHMNPLFVCRYPQSNDLIHWLSNIPNFYLHIYLSEYKKYLSERSAYSQRTGTIRNQKYCLANL
jgi:hypothetical protein